MQVDPWAAHQLQLRASPSTAFAGLRMRWGMPSVWARANCSCKIGLPPCPDTARLSVGSWDSAVLSNLRCSLPVLDSAVPCTHTHTRAQLGSVSDSNAVPRPSPIDMHVCSQAACRATTLQSSTHTHARVQLGSVSDQASKALADVRARRQANMEALRKLMDDQARELLQKGASDSKLVTLTRGRFCVGIKVGARLPAGIHGKKGV